MYGLYGGLGKTPTYKSAPVMEGPTVMKWDGVYYLFYSANHFMNIDYSVGYATASSPFGPWKKHPNSPIIHRSLVGENGSGHGDVFKGLDGNITMFTTFIVRIPPCLLVKHVLFRSS